MSQSTPLDALIPPAVPAASPENIEHVSIQEALDLSEYAHDAPQPVAQRNTVNSYERPAEHSYERHAEHSYERPAAPQEYQQHVHRHSQYVAPPTVAVRLPMPIPVPVPVQIPEYHDGQIASADNNNARGTPVASPLDALYQTLSDVRGLQLACVVAALVALLVHVPVHTYLIPLLPDRFVSNPMFPTAAKALVAAVAMIAYQNAAP